LSFPAFMGLAGIVRNKIYIFLPMVKGIYLHIPFCTRKCPYCDFTSFSSAPLSPEEYIELLIHEISLYGSVPAQLKSVYFGGGTPSILKPNQIGKLLEEIDRVFGLGSVEEITVECNPENYSYGEFKELLSFGVNRLSFGVQSFTAKGLKALGRNHTVERAVKTVKEAKDSGISFINVDLIYGWEGQKEEDILIDLEMLSSLPVDHLSWYLLTLYEDTPMARRNPNLPDEEQISLFHELIRKGLKELGFKRYEVSNWAKPGKECKHNLLYWSMEEFLGFGVSAWGFYGRKRYGNVKSLQAYAKLLKEGRKPVYREIFLDEEEFEKEYIMLSLRLVRGLPESYRKFIPDHLREFFTERGRVAVKEEFFLLLNEITAEFLKNWEVSLRKASRCKM